MIKIFLIKKEKGRIYKSENIVRDIFGFELNHDEKGAPLLRTAEGADASKYISISDTKNYWGCAIEEHQIGIDIEELGRAIKPSITCKLCKDEQEYLESLSEGSREWKEEFFSIWTKKEAYSKYLGKGMSIGFSRFSVLGESVEGVPIGGFITGDLVFGVAGDSQGFAMPQEYDAPMEKTALDYAAGLLDLRSYTSEELSKKLSERGYKEGEIGSAIEKLKEYGYVNDEAYAKSFATRGAKSGKGSRRIEKELVQKGIDKELAKKTADAEKGNERERAFEIAKNIYEKDPLPIERPQTLEAKQKYYKKRQKLGGKISRKLASLGYDAGIIYSVLEDIIK